MSPSRYAKFLLACIPAVLAGLWVLYEALGDGTVSAQEWTYLAISALSAVLVRQIPNKPPVGQRSRPDISEQG